MHFAYGMTCASAIALTLIGAIQISSAQSLSWPYNLPPHVKYYPGDEVLAKRNNEILSRLQREIPVVVKKMDADPGQMFFLDYWSFDERDWHDIAEWANSSSLQSFEPPVPLHAALPYSPSRFWERHPLVPVAAKLFSKRAFVCPSGTNACSSIDRPNVCCPSSSTCQIIQDTGLGDVGCCDANEICAGSLSQCPSGYTGCPNNPGGGCCLPGFQCFQEGCVQTSTTVVILTPTTTSTPPSQTTIIDTTTVVITPSVSSTSTQPTITSSSVSQPPPTITSTATLTSNSAANSLVCSSGARSCPASLGGGCCPTDRACGRAECPALTSTASLAPPVRGTSSSPTFTLTGSAPACPTGFYACSAYNPGGCCRVGRDCSSTSCPVGSGVTVVDSGSITVVAPTGTPVSQSLLTGACASGWSTCAADIGGGCCPSGYGCGATACTASVSGQTAVQGKIAPNTATNLKVKISPLWSCGISAIMVIVSLMA